MRLKHHLVSPSHKNTIALKHAEGYSEATMTNRPQKDIETKEDIITLVDTFYQKIQRDPMLGPAFNDVAKINWDTHLPRMYEFWETVLFSKPGYKGNPAEVHNQLNEKMKAHGTPLTLDHFDHWIALFQETVDDLFTGDRAERAKKSAYQQGRGLTVHIFQYTDFFTLRSK